MNRNAQKMIVVSVTLESSTSRAAKVTLRNGGGEAGVDLVWCLFTSCCLDLLRLWIAVAMRKQPMQYGNEAIWMVM